MRKAVGLVVAAGLLLGVGASAAYAETATATPVKKEVKEAAKAAVKGILSEEKRAAISTVAGNMIARLSDALSREQNLGGRVYAMIQKLENEGLDLTDATEKLAEAQNVWQKAAETVNGLQAEVEKVLSSEKPKVAFAAVKKLVKSAAADIKEARTLIIDTIRLVKDAKSAAKVATTTPETSAANEESAQE